jgi:hypothetical protein
MAHMFEDEVESRTNGRVQVDVIDDTDVDAEINPKSEGRGRNRRRRADKAAQIQDSAQAFPDYIARQDSFVGVRRSENYRKMLAGEVDISQSYTYFLAEVANPDYAVLELPYLFDDYAHVERALESPTGEGLLASAVDSHGIRGLAYTFSGGLLVMVGPQDVDLTSKAGWEDQRFEPVASEMRNQIATSLDVDMIVRERSALSLIDKWTGQQESDVLAPDDFGVREINLPDVEYKLAKYLDEPSETSGRPQGSSGVRLARHSGGAQPEAGSLAVTETQHVLLATVLNIREDSWDRLSAEDQVIVKEAALHAARFERQLTIDRYKAARTRLRAADFAWHFPTADERAEMKAATAEVYPRLFAEQPNTKALAEQFSQMAGESADDSGEPQTD